MSASVVSNVSPHTSVTLPSVNQSTPPAINMSTPITVQHDSVAVWTARGVLASLIGVVATIMVGLVAGWIAWTQHKQNRKTDDLKHFRELLVSLENNSSTNVLFGSGNQLNQEIGKLVLDYERLRALEESVKDELKVTDYSEMAVFAGYVKGRREAVTYIEKAKKKLDTAYEAKEAAYLYLHLAQLLSDDFPTVPASETISAINESLRHAEKVDEGKTRQTVLSYVYTNAGCYCYRVRENALAKQMFTKAKQAKCYEGPTQVRFEMYLNSLEKEERIYAGLDEGEVVFDSPSYSSYSCKFGPDGKPRWTYHLKVPESPPKVK